MRSFKFTIKNVPEDKKDIQTVTIDGIKTQIQINDGETPVADLEEDRVEEEVDEEVEEEVEDVAQRGKPNREFIGKTLDEITKELEVLYKGCNIPE